MLYNLIDLPVPIDKRKRSKVRYSIMLGRLLHLMYLMLKHSTLEDRIRKHIIKHDTLEQLVTDKELISHVLRRESRSPEEWRKTEARTEEYLRLVTTLKERKRESLLRLMDIVLDLSFHYKSMSHELLCNQLLGLGRSVVDYIETVGKVICRRGPFHIELRGYRFIVLEAECEKWGGLAKTVIHLGSLSDRTPPLGLLARLSIRSVDAEHLLNRQRKGYIFELGEKTFRLYPTVLRMQRLAYKRVKAVERFREEVLNLLSELYVDENVLASIIAGDVRANILAMVPSISLRGALCIPVAFRGELLETFGVRPKARIRAADLTLDAYTASFSVFEHNMYPGDYIFIAFHPFTAPRVCMVVASYPVDVLNAVKPRRRNVLMLDSVFPKISEVIKSRAETAEQR